MILKHTFGERFNYRLWLFGGLLQLLFIISSFSISPSSAQTACVNKCTANSTCVRRAQSCVALSCELYPDFYKAPNIKIGVSESENPFSETHSIGVVNRTKTLTIKSLNSTDTGRGIYYSQNEEKEDPFTCFFNIFVYDLDNYDGSISVGNETSTIKVNKTFGVIVKSFEEKVTFNFSYEALPLSRLRYNDRVLPDTQVSTCSAGNQWLNCLESDDIEVKLERCQNRYNIKVDYEYDYFDEYTSFHGGPLNRVHQHTIELFYPPQMKQEAAQYEFYNTTATFKLSCDVECGHPSTYAYSWIRTSDPDTVLFKGAEYEFSVQNLVSEPLMDEDVVELACKATNTVNQNDSPSSAGSRTVFKLVYRNQTEELSTSTESMGTTEEDLTTSTTPVDLTEAPKGLSGGAIAGIVVGSVAALILIVAVVLLLARRGTRSSKQESAPTPRRTDTTTANRRNMATAQPQQQFNSDLTPNMLYNMNMNTTAAGPSSSAQQNRLRSQSIYY